MWRRLTAAACVLASLAPARPAGAAPAGHVVRPGDTLAGIAARYRLPAAALRRWNNLGDRVTVDGMLRLSAPAAPLPPWRTRVEPVTAAQANGDPARICPVPVTHLRRIWVRYVDFHGRAHDGSLIMHRSAVAPTQRAFAALYRSRFPIVVMSPVEVNLPGLTDMSVATVGYHCRYVAGAKTWSQHAYGLAVDVNPRQNPMLRGGYLDPPGSEPWLDRSRYWAGMLHADGGAGAFVGEGFAWGGHWHSLKDYMHFSTTNR